MNHLLLEKHWDLLVLLSGPRKVSWIKTLPSSVLISPKMCPLSPPRGAADQGTFISPQGDSHAHTEGIFAKVNSLIYISLPLP